MTLKRLDQPRSRRVDDDNNSTANLKDQNDSNACNQRIFDGQASSICSAPLPPTPLQSALLRSFFHFSITKVSSANLIGSPLACIMMTFERCHYFPSRRFYVTKPWKRTTSFSSLRISPILFFQLNQRNTRGISHGKQRHSGVCTCCAGAAAAAEGEGR